jgi:uncharacterized protein involved in outer membrane biogenesis
MVDDRIPAFIASGARDGTARTRDPADDTRTSRPGPMKWSAGPPGLVAILARIVLAVVALLFLVFVLHPLWLAPVLGRHLSATSGRAVHFDSIRIGLTPSLAPVVHLRGVRIDNAPWAETREPFAVFADVVFVLGWQRFEQRHVVSRVLLRDGVVRLEQGADGRRNWRLADPEYRGPGRYWFYSLEAHDAKLAFTNHGIDLRVQAVTSDAAAAAAASGETATTRIDFDGALRGVAFAGRVATDPVLTFLETKRWFGLHGYAAIDGANLDVDGRAADLFRAMQIDANASLAGSSLAVLRPFLGERYAEPRAFRAQGHVRIDAGRYSLTEAQARVGATDLAGELAWSRSGSRHTVRAHVKSQAADLADLLWLAGQPAADITTAAAGRAASRRPGDRDIFAAARDLDADVAFEAARFHAAELRPLQSLKLRAELAAGRLAVSDLDVGWAGGHSSGRIGLDLRQPLATADASLHTRGVRVESLFAAQEEKKRITGLLDGQLALKASGNTTEALWASAAGTGSVHLSDGTISSLLDAELGLEGGKLVRTLLSGVDFLPLPCAAASVEVTGGHARIRSLVVDSANTRTTGSGTIDLRDAVIDLVLTPQPKRPGLFELKRSIRLFGRLSKPQRALVDRVEPPPSAACEATKP